MMDTRPDSDSQVVAEELFQATAELWSELLLEVAESISPFARLVTNGTSTEQREDHGPLLEVLL